MNDSTQIDATHRGEPARTRANRFRAVLTAASLTVTLAGAFAAPSAMAQDGTWDASWKPHDSNQKGFPGLLEDLYSLGGGGIYANDMTATSTVVQTDGKMLVAGFGWNTSNGHDQNACIVRRYNADGSVDTSFGNAGAVVDNFAYQSFGDDCYAKSLALQADGKILYAGQLVPQPGGPTPTALVARMNPDGSQDATFNGDGFLADFGKDLNSVMVAGNGDILIAGSATFGVNTDYEFYLASLSTTGQIKDEEYGIFDVPGSDKNDTGTAAVLESWSFGTIGNFHSHDEVYVVGLVDNPPYATGQYHHSCGVVAFTRTDGGVFSRDSGFGGGGFLRVDFPVGTLDTDTFCRTAVARPGTVGAGLFGPSGVVVGGERYYTPKNAPLGSASYYALEEIDAGGSVTRHDSFGFFADLNEPGAFNSINSMVWDNIGKLVTVGYAGIGTNGDQTHAPSDGVVRRFSSDYSVDGSFAADHSGTLFASLDTLGVGFATGQREYINTLAADPRHGRVVFAGERSVLIGLLPNYYAWFLGAVHDGNVVISDRIFANGFD